MVPGGFTVPSHQQIEARSLALHRLVADKIKGDPALFKKAKATLARWRETVSPRSRPYLDEWERIMSEGLDACLSIAVEDSEHATTLRQCSPFTGILTNQERFAFLKTWKVAHASSGA